MALFGRFVALILVLHSATVMAAEPRAAADRERLITYARDTWKSLDALAATGILPADALRRDGAGWTPTPVSSPSDIAAYLWSTVAAERLGLIRADESGQRLAKTLTALGQLDRPSGFFLNWYDSRSGAPLRTWPGGGTVRPFLSTVDNAWLAAALMVVSNSRPDLRPQAESLLSPMNFGRFYDAYDPANPSAHPGLFRGGIWADDNSPAGYHYGTLNTETRIAVYVAIARGQVPPEVYYRMTRGRSTPGAPTRTYRGVTVVEAAQTYRDLHVVPSWDGTMFEALMVPLFVPEADWAPESWGVNHALYVRAQIEYALDDAKLGVWGISASTEPGDGYHAFGVSALAERSRPEVAAPRVVTPHATFLALPYAPREAMANLEMMAAKYPVYTEYGFLDAIDVGTGAVSQCVLAFDQGMIMAALVDVLGDRALQRSFSLGAVETSLRPVIAPERFEIGGPAPLPAIARRAEPVTSQHAFPFASAIVRLDESDAKVQPIGTTTTAAPAVVTPSSSSRRGKTAVGVNSSGD